ncbi:hypothetical protein LINPERHAP1_LOCUS36564 [Linum perenne]
MVVSLVHSSSSSSCSTSPSTFQSNSNLSKFQSLPNPTSYLLPNSPFPGSHSKKWIYLSSRSSSSRTRNLTANTIQATLLESPVLWAGRICVSYALLRFGLAGSKSNPLVSGINSTN